MQVGSAVSLVKGIPSFAGGITYISRYGLTIIWTPQKHHSQDQAFWGAWGGESELTATEVQSRNQTFLHLKMGAWKRSFLLESIIFSVHGSFAGGCWLLKHFQRFLRVSLWIYFRMVWNEGNGMVLLLHGDRKIFQKVTEYYLLFYCVNLQIVTVFFQKAYFLGWQKIPAIFLVDNHFSIRRRRPSFSIIFLVDKKNPKNPFPGDLESMRFSLLVAALGHDIGHPGVNNGCSTAEREANEANISKQKHVAGVEGGVAGTVCLGGWHNGRVRKESTM